MGTRSATNVVDEEGNIYVSLYRQFDGYPKGGHGEELADFLEGAIIGNGISGSQPPNFFNGLGDLALRMVTFFRQDYRQCGGFYLQPPAKSGWGADYIYTIVGATPMNGVEKGVTVKVDGYSRKGLFAGTQEEFAVWVQTDCSVFSQRASR